MNRIEYLIIADTNDFTSDYIAIELNLRRAKYLRINRDKFHEYQINWNIIKGEMNVKICNENYVIDEGLKGVYYRAPVYIRYYSNNNYEEQLYKSQWMGFVKNLICFENAKWINNPVSTYKAENKMLQLKYAKDLGFIVPETLVINGSTELIKNDMEYAVKSIDTLFLRNHQEEGFLYTNVICGKEINNSELGLAPIVVQEFLNPKVDLRVTVIGKKVYTVKIVKNNIGVKGDWRKEKDDVEFIPFQIPKNIENMCVDLVEKLGLSYGAIDLAISNDKYYFVEINPTGEWAWLIESAKFDIDKTIVDYLLDGK